MPSRLWWLLRACASAAMMVTGITAAVSAQQREVAGRLEVLWGMRPSMKGAPQNRYYIFDAARRANVEVQFEPNAVAAFGGAQALNGKRLRVTVGETGLAGASAPMSASAIRDIAPDIGGRRVPDLHARLDAHHGDHGPPPSSSRAQLLVSGSRRYVTILCKYKDNAAEPGTKSDYEKLFGDPSMSVWSYWKEVSENRVNFDGSIVVGWLTLPHDSAYYFPDGAENADLDRLANDCTAAADPLVDFTQFDGINTQFNGSLGCCAWGGGNTLSLDGQVKSYGFTWFPPLGTPPRNVGIIAHEIGHSLGLPHSGGPYGRTYDSKWDVMSWGSAFIHPATGRFFGAQTVAYHKLLLEWIPESRKFVASAPVSRVLLERSALPGATNYQIVVIPIGGTAQYYTLENRRRAGYDAQLAREGVVIHHVKPTGRAEPAWVVDADGDGDPNDEGAVWTPGETFSDAANAIRVTVDSLVGTAYAITISRSNAAATMALGTTGKSASVSAGAPPALDSVAVTLSLPGGWSARKINARGPWLELVSANGTGSGQLRLRRNPTGLGVGRYVDTVLVSAAGVATAEQYVDTLDVNDTGSLFLGLSTHSRKDSLLEHALFGIRDSVEVRITGPGAASVVWAATKKRITTKLSASGLSGTGPGYVKWVRAHSSQPAGLYIDTITVSATGSPDLSATIVDTLEIRLPVAIALTPRTRRDSLPEGALPQLDSSVVTLSGDWATGGWIVTSTPYSLRAGKFLRSGNGAGAVRVGSGTIYWTRAPRALGPGTYVDTISICGPVCAWGGLIPGHAGAQYIVDTLTVLSAPLMLSASPASRRDSTSGLNISKDSVTIVPLGSGAGTSSWQAKSPKGRSVFVSAGAFVTPGSGKGSGWLRWARNVAGRVPGTYVDTIVVSMTGVPSINIVDTVTLLPAAVLALGRGSSRMLVVAGLDSARDSLDVRFLGTGGASLTWNASARAPWTTLATSSGVGPGKLRWTRDASSFTVGQLYVDTITVTAPGVYDGVIQLVDTLEGAPGAALALAKRSRLDSAAANLPLTIPDSVAIKVSGSMGATTTWTVTNRRSWNALVTLSGTGSTFLKWTRASMGLAVGLYVDTITVSASGALFSPVSVIDTLRIVAGTAVALNVSSRSAPLLHGGSRTSHDSALATIAGFAATTSQWTAAKKANWITLTTASGGTNARVHWTRSAASLAAGTYVDTILVSVAGSPAAPVRIVDTLRVRAVAGLDAARQLLGIGTLTAELTTLLDQEGNADGAFNLGDVLAHLDRTGATLTNATLIALVTAGQTSGRPDRAPPDSSRGGNP